MTRYFTVLHVTKITLKHHSTLTQLCKSALVHYMDLRLSKHTVLEVKHGTHEERSEIKDGKCTCAGQAGCPLSLANTIWPCCACCASAGTTSGTLSPRPPATFCFFTGALSGTCWLDSLAAADAAADDSRHLLRLRAFCSWAADFVTGL